MAKTTCIAFIIILILINPIWAQFGQDVRIDNASGVAMGCMQPEIVCSDDGTLYVVWEDDREIALNWTIYCSRSTDGGLTWGPDVLVEDTINGSIEPDLAVDNNGTLYCVWNRANHEVRFAKSTDGGNTWTPTVRVDHAPQGTSVLHPHLAVNYSSEIFVAWSDERSGNHCYFSKSTDGGITWCDDIEISYNSCSWPKIKVCGDTVYTTYNCYTGSATSTDVYLSRSIDGGNTWQIMGRVNDTDYGRQYGPALAIASGSILYCAWYNDYGTNGSKVDIFFAKSTDAGVTWTPSIPIRDTMYVNGYAFFTELHIACADQNNVYCVWDDYRNGPGGGYFDTYFTASTDGGNNWLHPNIMVNDTSYQVNTRFSAICAANNRDPCVVWSDTRPGNWYIYFDRGDLTGIHESTQYCKNSLVLQIHPNPFTKLTRINFGIGQNAENIEQRVELKIYDATGRVVKNFSVPTAYSLLPTVISWDGRGNQGNELAAGVYICRLEVGESTVTKKIIKLN